MNITATHINYYFICKRKLWLFANGLNMEHTSDTVSEGKLIHEMSYPQRAARYTEVEMEGIKIDFFDPKNKVVHEIKKSDKLEEAHLWQVKYYLYVLQKNGIDATGIIEYPKLRKAENVILEKPDIEELERIVNDIYKILATSNTCPEKIKKNFCRKCSYFDFCYAE